MIICDHPCMGESLAAVVLVSSDVLGPESSFMASILWAIRTLALSLHNLSGREPKNGGLGPEQPGALLVTLLAQVVVLYVGPDSLGHLRGRNLLAFATTQYGS